MLTWDEVTFAAILIVTFLLGVGFAVLMQHEQNHKVEP